MRRPLPRSPSCAPSPGRYERGISFAVSAERYSLMDMLVASPAAASPVPPYVPGRLLPDAAPEPTPDAPVFTPEAILATIGRGTLDPLSGHYLGGIKIGIAGLTPLAIDISERAPTYHEHATVYTFNVTITVASRLYGRIAVKFAVASTDRAAIETTLGRIMRGEYEATGQFGTTGYPSQSRGKFSLIAVPSVEDEDGDEKTAPVAFSRWIS
jgi:hypothetical protein